MTELRPELWLPGAVPAGHGAAGVGPDPRELDLAWTCFPGDVRLESRLGEISLEPLPPGPPPSLQEPWRMELASSDGPFTILAERRLFQAFLAELPEKPVLDAMEERESSLIAEFACLDLIEAAEILFGTSLLVTRLSAAAALGQPHWRLWVKLVLPDGEPEYLMLGFPGQPASMLMRKLVEPQAADPRLGGLPVQAGSARLFIGMLDLPEDSVGELERDDIIIIEGCRDNIISGIFVCDDGMSWNADVSGATAEVTSLPGNAPRLPMLEWMPNLSRLEPRPLGGMVRVAFEFGSTSYDPRSIRRIKLGDDLEVTRLHQGMVRIFCAGRPIGDGRVVHVDGGIGVKIESRE